MRDDAVLRPWDNRGKCYMNRKRIQWLSNASQHVPIYLQPFPRNSSRNSRANRKLGHDWLVSVFGLFPLHDQTQLNSTSSEHVQFITALNSATGKKLVNFSRDELSRVVCSHYDPTQLNSTAS